MRFKVPANIDMADRIVAGLTARQLGILAGHAVVLWGLWSLLAERVPYAVLGILALPVVAIGLVWVTTKPEGSPLEELARNACRYLLRPRRHVLAPEGISEELGPAGDIAAIELPFGQVDREGHIDLHSAGVAMVCRASSVNFALRSEQEQRALIEGFARLLNSLDAPVQFLVRADRIDLAGLLKRMESDASELPHPALVRAAADHVSFLRSLSDRRDVLSRQVLVCLREPVNDPADGLTRLDHRTEEMAALLRGMGIRITRLNGGAVSRLLARATDPGAVHVDSAASDGDRVVRGLR